MAKTLKIDTFLGPATNLNPTDELLLTSFDGREGVSVPFTYDLVLMRQAAKVNVERKLQGIIGTSARIGLLRKGEDLQGRPKYIHRVGSFSQFERIGISENKFLVYKARLIPAVMLWGGGVTFRVFEKMNVVDIISDVLEDIRKLSVDVRFDLSRLRKPEFPRLPYCVQYGESCFGFLCRLMAEHGISYFFDRGKDQRADGHAGPAENDTLVLVGPKDTAAKSCEVDGLKATTAGGLEDEKVVAAFTRSNHSSHHSVSIGNYNPVSPTRPLHADRAVAKEYDLLSLESGATAGLLRREQFPSPVSRDPDPDEDRFVDDHAEQAMHREEQGVFTFSGVVKNSSFVAGRTFKLDEDDVLGQFAKRTFQLTWVQINAFENSYGSTTGQDVEDTFIGFGLGVLHALTFNIFKKEGLDLTTAMAGVAFDNYAQKQQEVALAKWWYPKSTGKHEGELVLPGMASKWAAVALGNFVDALKNIVNRNAGAFTMKFAAVPWDQGMFLRPQVSASRPVAGGPQLATVVGPSGSTKGQSFVDHQLGRVRVRFPWHQKLSGGADFTDRFETSDTTAWVPVSQVWAGTRVGSQFLPRVGDQVVVEYLDGDPERPVITGCVYHADSGRSHLPFSNEELHGRKVTTKSLFEAGGQTVTLSGLHTHSTPKPEGSQDRYHLLRFDDRYNDEQLLMRSQGRLDVTAKCSHYETTEGNRHVLVRAGTDADGKTIGGASSFMTVGGDHNVHVGGSRYEAIDTDQQLTVKGNTHFDLKGDWINVVGGKLSLNAGTIVIEASQKLTLKVGGSTVVLNPCGVYVDGPLIHNQNGGPADTAADATINDVADAVKADPGEPAYMRTEMPGGCQGGGGGGGGKWRARTVPAQHALPCTLDSEHMICLPLSQLCSAD
jgi:uncharacterized protein involved in type VI secretion and phage assembly